MPWGMFSNDLERQAAARYRRTEPGRRAGEKKEFDRVLSKFRDALQLLPLKYDAQLRVLGCGTMITQSISKLVDQRFSIPTDKFADISDCLTFLRVATDFINEITAVANETKLMNKSTLDGLKSDFVQHSDSMYKKLAPGCGAKFIGAIQVLLGIILFIPTIGLSSPMILVGCHLFRGIHAKPYLSLKTTVVGYQNELEKKPEAEVEAVSPRSLRAARD